MNFFLTNQNNAERIVRFITSLFLLPAPIIYETSNFSLAQFLIGGILIFNAFSGMCVIYRFFGVNTCRINQWKLMVVLMRQNYIKKFFLGNLSFGIITILFLTYTIYGILTRDEFSLLSLLITFWYIGYGYAYVDMHRNKNKK